MQREDRVENGGATLESSGIPEQVGFLWAGPIVDGMSDILALLLVRCEMKAWS